MALTKISRGLLSTGISDSSDATAITIDSSENVGIGAAPTLGALHVTSSLTDIVTFENTDAGTTGAQLILYHNSSSPADGDRVGALNFKGQDDAGNDATYAGIRCLATDVSNTTEDGTLTFSTTRAGTFTEAMRIDSSGNIGIGTTSPSAPLTVSTTGSGDAVIIESTEAGSSNAPDLVLHRNSASPADDDSLGIIRFRGKNDASEAIDLANIFGQVTDVSDGSEDSTLYFKTYKDGAEQSPLTLAGGDVLIGNTFPSGNYTDASMTPSLRLGNGVNIGIGFNRLSISTSASAVFDTSNISNDGQSASGGDGLYMFTLVRTGGSWGTRFVGILGVDDSVCAIVETLENENFTVTTSGTVLSAAISYSGSAISCVATLQPLAIGE